MSDDGTPDQEEKSVGALAAEIAQETSAIKGLLSDYASKSDVERALIEERTKTKALVEERDAARRGRTFVLVGALLLVAMVAVWALNVSSRVDREADARESDRLDRAAQSCDSANITRGQINAGNDAKDALADATRAVQDELDLSLEPLINAPDDALTVEQRAFRDRYLSGKTTVTEKLKIASGKIAAARVPLRDCSHPDDSTALLPIPTTTTTTTLGG